MTTLQLISLINLGVTFIFAIGVVWGGTKAWRKLVDNHLAHMQASIDKINNRCAARGERIARLEEHAKIGKD